MAGFQGFQGPKPFNSSFKPNFNIPNPSPAAGFIVNFPQNAFGFTQKQSFTNNPSINFKAPFVPNFGGLKSTPNEAVDTRKKFNPNFKSQKTLSNEPVFTKNQPIDASNTSKAFVPNFKNKQFINNEKKNSQHPFENFQQRPKRKIPDSENPSGKFQIPETKASQYHIKEDKSDFEEDLGGLETEYRKRALATFNKKKKTLQAPIQTSKQVSAKSFTKETKPQPIKKSPVLPSESPEKPSFKQTNRAFSGQNSIMCSLEESKSREESHQLSIFELKPGDHYEMNSFWTIKKYLRSSADREEDIRSPEALTNTLKYLIDEIIDVDTNGNPNNYRYSEDLDFHTFKDIYPFVFDRMRAIVKDWKMINNNDNAEYIKDHEKIARFLIMSCVEGYDFPDFNQNLNLKLLEDVLSCLMKAYQSQKEKKTVSIHESEFTTYFIVLKPDNILNKMTQLKNLSEKTLKESYIQIGLQIFSAFHSENYAEFFNIMKTAPYLLVCACYPLFNYTRVTSLIRFFKTSTKNMLLVDFKDVLWFSDFDEAERYAEEIGLFVEKNYENQALSIVKVSDLSEKFSFQFKTVPNNIQEKKFDKTRKEIISSQEKIEPSSSPDKKETFVQEKIPFTEEKIIFAQEKFSFTQEKIIIDPPQVKIQIPEEKPKPNTEKIKEFEIENVINSIIRIIENEEISHVVDQILKENFNKESFLEPERKILFKFPDDDKAIFSIVKDPKEKQELVQVIRNYRKQKKIDTRAKEKKYKLLRELMIFTHWKRYFTWKKLKKYILTRRMLEMNSFSSQFSNDILSDNLAYSRSLSMKRPKFEESMEKRDCGAVLKKIPNYNLF